MSRRLRVGFDGRALESPSGGIRRYVSELAGALATFADDLQLYAVGPSPSCALPAGVASFPASSWLPSNLGWAVGGLPLAVRRLHVDVFHAPAYTAPLWGVHPLIVTLHDVSYARYPAWYPYRLDPARRQFYRRSAAAADLVITDSEYSRGEIEAAYGIGRDKIRVVPLGVGKPFVNGGDDVTRHKSDVPSLVHVGDLHPRRNAAVIVETLAGLRALSPALAATELTLVGKDCGSGEALTLQARSLGVADAVHFVGHADDRTVVELLRRASAFVYPSLYEGFGLPALEAMACGTPVVASNAASIPEVVGEAGMLVDPLDVKAWVRALAAVLTSPERASAMASAGRARAATFSWTRTAALTLDAYRAVARP